MATIGYFLSTEEHGPQELVEQARRAEQAGFEALWISDHYHPWNDAQGQSPFVWGVLGAISQVISLPVTTAVTCPTIRIHPAVVAQAAATAATLLDGRFVLGVGSGEALNEHVTGSRWPSTDVRLEMLEEAVEVMRALWAGDFVNHHGRHYTVEHARVYTLPATPPPVYVSAFGPKAVEVAGRIGDGYVGTTPDADLLAAFDAAGGAGKPKQGGLKVCWGSDADEARRTLHRLWGHTGVPGEASQELPSPRHFEQLAGAVEPGDLPNVCGDDVDAHVSSVTAYVDAGYTEVYVNQVGPDQESFFTAYEKEILPRLR